MATERLEELPDGGLVVLGHPENEEGVRRAAEDRGLDYLLTVFAPVRVKYLLDVDAVLRGPSEWRSGLEPT